MKVVLVAVLDLYQKWISPLLGHHCRFYPSCSAYGKNALAQKGFWAGTALLILRVMKCHPLHPGGYDPVKP